MNEVLQWAALIGLYILTSVNLALFIRIIRLIESHDNHL